MTKFFNSMKIGQRIAFGFAFVLILTVGIITPAILMQMENAIEQAELHELEEAYESITTAIDDEGRMAEALSSFVANIPKVQQAFSLGDRDALAELMVPTFETMKKQYNVRQFQFHTPPATSFLRVHKPGKFGDDLSSFRKTVVETNRMRKAISGIEKGVAGLGVRGIVPVYQGSNHLGSVEFGLSFDQAFFDKIKAQRGIDIALHLSKNGVFETFASTLGETALLSDDDLSRGFAGEAKMTKINYEGSPKSVLAKVVNDFSGTPIGVLEIAIDRSHYVKQLADARNTAILIGVVALVVGMAISGFITFGIVCPLKKAASAMKEIAEGDGDLTQRLDIPGKHEIAQLANAFNQFSEKVRGIVTQVSSSTTELASASEDMMRFTSESEANVFRQRAEIDQLATAMNEMAATVQEVARNAVEAATSAQATDAEANAGRQVVANTVVAINGLASEVEDAAGVIKRLELASENIGSVLDVIRDIAEQTNLLALNAAIEAARAGEQGRGFAVVADEVRTLASRTQKSTEEIQSMIEGLQADSRNAVSAMEQGQSQAGNSVEQADKAGASLEQITMMISGISDMNTQIASAAEEQSAVTEEINKNIVNINEMAEHTSSGAKQAAESGGRITELATELRGVVNQFKV